MLLQNPQRATQVQRAHDTIVRPERGDQQCSAAVRSASDSRDVAIRDNLVPATAHPGIDKASCISLPAEQQNLLVTSIASHMDIFISDLILNSLHIVHYQKQRFWGKQEIANTTPGSYALISSQSSDEKLWFSLEEWLQSSDFLNWTNRSTVSGMASETSKPRSC